MYTPPEVPLSIGGVLDDGFSLLKASFTKVFPLALVGSVISGTPNMFLPGDDPAALMEMSAVMSFFMLAASLVSLVFLGAIIAMIDAVSKNRKMSFAEAVGVGLRHFLPVLGCVILILLAVTAGFVALLIPGIILSLSLAMAPYLVVADGIGPIASLKKSHQLVWGNWWRTAAIFSVVIFITVSAYFLVGMLAGIGLFVAPGEGGLFANLIVVVLNASLTPVFYTFGMSVLRDLQLRKHGDDLDNRVSAIASE